MDTDDIDSAYQALIEQSRKRGELGEGSGDERRSTPRIHADATELTVRAQLQVSAVDVSVGGVAFHSEFPVQRGQMVVITVGSLFSVEAEVVHCALLEADEDYTHTLFRVQCRFRDEEQGKYMLVMVKELDRRKSDPESSPRKVPRPR